MKRESTTLPPSRRLGWSKVLGWIAAAVAIYLPCRYFAPLNASYYVDWANHEWSIGYFGEFIRSQHAVPSAFNTLQLGGIAVPVFYGNLFYPLMGLASSVLAPGVVIRIAAICMFCLQYRLVSRALVRIDAPLYLARVVACLAIWATYPLTNLYNRSALTEFFATSLLVCALAALVLLLHATDAAERRRYASGMMFSLTVSAGTHPITALYGIPLFVALGPLCWWLLREDRARRWAIVRSLAPWSGLAVACVLPWYLAVARYSDALSISGSHVRFFAASIDHWKTRFFPIPWDPRVAPGIALDDVPTPYLDSQVSISLLILFLVVGGLAVTACWRRRRWAPLAIFGIASGFVAFFTWLSLSPASYNYLPNTAQMIQFAYRAVTYINLSLLLGLFFVLMALPATWPGLAQTLRRPAMMSVAAGCLVLALAGVFVKWSHIAAIKGHKSSPHWILDDDERRALVELPQNYYGASGYSTRSLYIALEDSVKVQPRAFTFSATEHFGDARPMRLVLSEPTWVVTNIQLFPWNQFAIDGTAVPSEQQRSREDRITILVPAGSHTVMMRFRPPMWWRVLRLLSLGAIVAWTVFLVTPALAWPFRRIAAFRHGAAGQN